MLYGRQSASPPFFWFGLSGAHSTSSTGEHIWSTTYVVMIPANAVLQPVMSRAVRLVKWAAPAWSKRRPGEFRGDFAAPKAGSKYFSFHSESSLSWQAYQSRLINNKKMACDRLDLQLRLAQNGVGARFSKRGRYLIRALQRGSTVWVEGMECRVSSLV